MNEQEWQVRVGQLETLLHFVGSMGSMTIRRSDGVSVYVQVLRVDDGYEIEAVANQYLPPTGQLDADEVAQMSGLGWETPGEVSPNFWRFVDGRKDLHELAQVLARTLDEVYRVSPDDAWSVSPPELAHEELAGADPAVIQQLEEHLELLRNGQGPALAVAVATEVVPFADLVAMGLPRGDVFAEMAMLHRTDCTVEFFRASSVREQALKSATLPATVIRRLLDSPSAFEIESLSERRDIPRRRLAEAASLGLAQARNAFVRSQFLRLGVLPVQKLIETTDAIDDLTVGVLRHPRCPAAIVERHVLSGAARVRRQALVAVRTRGIVLDAGVLQAAAEMPMTERSGSRVPSGPAVQALVAELLAAPGR